MIRASSFAAALAALVTLVPSVLAQAGPREPRSLDALWLGRQVAGPTLTETDLEGRVVLAYHWCVT